MVEVLTIVVAVGGDDLGPEFALGLNHPDPDARKSFPDAVLLTWWQRPEFLGDDDNKRMAMRERLGDQFDALPPSTSRDT